jgi:pimeloyl-ACP methyl ester carboxylesterase
MKTGVLVALLALSAAAASSPKVNMPLSKAASAVKKMLPGETIDLKTADGWALQAVYAPAAEGKKTLVLLHGTGQRKEDWKSLALPLTRAGYGLMAVDLRGHGESRTNPAGEVLTWKQLKATTKADNDFLDMSRDADAVVAFLTGKGVAEESIGFIGAEVGGSVALRYAATHPKVPLVILLSPGMKWQEVLTVNALRAMKRPTPTPLLMVYSEADRTSSKEAPIMYSFAKAAVGEKLAVLVSVPQERGTRMLRAQPALIEQIISWIGNPVAPEAPVSTSAVVAPPTDDGDD